MSPQAAPMAYGKKFEVFLESFDRFFTQKARFYILVSYNFRFAFGNNLFTIFFIS